MVITFVKILSSYSQKRVILVWHKVSKELNWLNPNGTNPPTRTCNAEDVQNLKHKNSTLFYAFILSAKRYGVSVSRVST